jgi:hypothetical protein
MLTPIRDESALAGVYERLLLPENRLLQKAASLI